MMFCLAETAHVNGGSEACVVWVKVTGRRSFYKIYVKVRCDGAKWW